VSSRNLFNANVVLIEDKASGTQLIQELIAEGCHGVTRYQPGTDKIMRMHAQTAMIENGFVHIPQSAPWLAEYPHEVTVFPMASMTTRPMPLPSSSTGSSCLSPARGGARRAGLEQPPPWR
jgi:hypothetical protein